MITPVFQPIPCLKSNVLFGAEVLSRWLIDDVFYPPGDAQLEIDWADIDPQIVILLIENIAAIEARYPRLMVNVSDQTMESDRRFAAWIDLVERFRSLTSVEIIVEVTEGVKDTSLMKRWDVLRKSAKGISMMMDDFGYQRSTHERLLAFPWAGCKFNVKKLVASSEKDMQGLLYCHRHGIPVIGEQVETDKMAAQALQMGIHFQQGYHHGRPTLLEGWKWRAVSGDGLIDRLGLRHCPVLSSPRGIE